MRYINLLAVVISVVLVIFEPGCMKCSEKAGEKIVEQSIKQATGGKAKVDVGSVDISALPENLRYPNAVAKGKFEIASEDGRGINWNFETTDPAGQVVEFYKNALSSWKRSATSETPEVTTMIFGSPDEKEMVIVAVGKEEGGKTTLNLTHIEK